MKTKFTRISSVLLAILLLVAMVPMQALALDNGGAGGSEAGELQWICVSGAHSWDAGEVTTAATCTGTGVMTFTCTLCHQTKTENIPALGHAYGEWTVTTEPTCTTAGQKTRVCEHDSTHIDVEEIPATGHTLTATEAVAATCTTPGNTAYWTCSECGKYFSDENGETEIAADSWIIPAAGHTWVAWQEGDDIADFTLKTEATTESAAVYYKNCSVDGTSAQGIDEDATFTYGDPLPAEPDILYGDANGDGEVDILDVTLLRQVLAGLANGSLLSDGADANADSEVDILDVALLRQVLAGLVGNSALGPQE